MVQWPPPRCIAARPIALPASILQVLDGLLARG